MKFAMLLFFASAIAFAQAPCAPGSFTGTWNGWGAGTSNTRYQASTSITPQNVAQLDLKWSFGFPGSRSVMGQPSVVDGRVYVGADTGQVYALDASTGCVLWSYKADAAVRTAISLASASENKKAAYFGDSRGKVYAVDAASGAEIWKIQVETHASAKLTGAPVFFENHLYVPVSSGEEGAGGGANYACCTFRGSVVALEASSGKQIWKTM